MLLAGLPRGEPSTSLHTALCIKTLGTCKVDSAQTNELNSDHLLSQNPHLAGDLLTERAGLCLGDALLLPDLAGLRL